MRKASNHHLKYIQHSLNPSKSKTSYSFTRSERFKPEKSYSPNKFYKLPSTMSHRASTMGFGDRPAFEKADSVQPTRYNIPTEFQKIKSNTPKFTTFGISREDYYKGKSSKNPVGPGAYSVELSRTRLDPPTQKHNVSAATYEIKGATVSRLSTFRNNENAFRIKTDYYPKGKLQQYDNHIPGPASYALKQSNNRVITQSKAYFFGKEARIKASKPCNVGPGSYKAFSQFGFS